ncbi:MAG: GspH/FimT family pseudopilin [Desulfonatronovibrionaceae bacterium]
MNKKSPERAKGFTIIELMVAVAVVAVLVTLATNSLSTLLPKMRLNSAARDVLADIEETKMKAIERGSECTIDFSALNSYTICVENDSTAGCSSATDEIIKTVNLAERYDNHIQLHDPSFSSHTRVTFDKLGLPDGTFGHVFCRNNNNSTKKVVVGFNGNVKIE